MICTVDGSVYRGRAVGITEVVSPDLLARAVREGQATDGDVVVTVTARTPHDVHEYVGCLHPGQGLRVKTALASAARARGHCTPYDEQLAKAQRDLAAVETQAVDTRDQRRTLAAAQSETDRLRERVAALRGRLDARREQDLPTEEARDELRAAIRDLSDAETGAAAARQRLDRERERGRAARDSLAERRRLEDKVANLQRRRRAHLVEGVRPAYESALADVPGGPEGVPADPFDADPLLGGLAVARVAAPDAPVVVACDRFPSARAASAWLDAPVLAVAE